jgi:hypothetical protein
VWLSLLNGFGPAARLLVLEMECWEQGSSCEVENGKGDTKTPDSFGFKTVALGHTTPGLEREARSYFADVIFNILKDIAAEALPGVVAVERGNWAADGD